MKNALFLLRSTFVVAICIVFFCCTPTNKDQLPEPKIEMGTAQLTGLVTNLKTGESEENPILKLIIPNAVTGEATILETHLSDDGSFNFEAPLESNYVIATLFSTLSDNPIIIGLASGKETKLTINKKEGGNVQVNMSGVPELTPNDMLNLGDVMTKMATTASNYSSFYKISPQEFASVAIKNMEDRLSFAANDSTLSKSAKILIMNEFKLLYLDECLLDYDDYMSLNYQNFKTEEEPDDFTPQKPDLSYYAFLKYFNLNDLQYLYNDTYSKVLRHILSIDTFNIQPIKDKPINQWLDGLKATLADLIGSNSGLFYDMLAVNAYIKQFENELEPLSDKQIQNIKDYFKNKEITKILLNKNDEIIRFVEQKSNPIVKKTPDVAQTELMDAIISQYKGKVVFVDFWATWCAPCLMAMKEFRDAKSQYKGKEIVFVYITSTSSPLKVWEQKIEGIGGDHYYLTENEWEYLLDSFNFDGIPTYQLYDTNGVLKNQITGYPGTTKIQEMIKELLPE